MPARNSFARILRLLLFLTLPSCGLVCGALEVFFRAVIPASDRPYAQYDARWKLLRYDPQHHTSGRYTAGKLAQVRSRWRINSDGWNSEIDYERRRSQGRTRIAVIGDSFVEAFQVDPDESFSAQARRMLGDAYEVYSFGFSGSPLSHYLQMARYAIHEFDPDILVFNVVSNDFRQSLCEVRHPEGMLCFAQQNGEWVESPVIAFTPNPIKRLARRSAMVRYWYHNLGGRIRWRPLMREFDTNPRKFRFSLNEQEQEALRQRIRLAVSSIMDAMERQTRGRRVIFQIAVDSIYDAEDLNQAPSGWMRKLLQTECLRHGFEFLDLDAAFQEAYALRHERFESAYDSHWNQAGHRVVAEALSAVLMRNHSRVMAKNPL